jgi:hypothetical protein
VSHLRVQGQVCFVCFVCACACAQQTEVGWGGWVPAAGWSAPATGCSAGMGSGEGGCRSGIAGCAGAGGPCATPRMAPASRSALIPRLPSQNKCRPLPKLPGLASEQPPACWRHPPSADPPLDIDVARRLHRRRFLRGQRDRPPRFGHALLAATLWGSGGGGDSRCCRRCCRVAAASPQGQQVEVPPPLGLRVAARAGRCSGRGETEGVLY